MASLIHSLPSFSRTGPRASASLARLAQSPHLIVFAVLLGLSARVFLIALSANHTEGLLGGGSDAPAFVLLGDSISKGHGMAYVGQPTALRAPLYPLMLAGLDLLFGSYSLLSMRLVQLVIAALTAWISGKTAARLWGESAKWPAVAIATCAPTLLFFTTQILTESFAAFFVSLFFYYLVRQAQDLEGKSWIGLGVFSGTLLLLRFNTVFLPLVAGITALRLPSSYANFRRALFPVLISLVFVSPWIIRNIIVFQGDIWYSSQPGTTAYQGALAPEGRTQPHGLEELQKRQGWWLSTIETDSPTRLNYPSEAELNRKARKEALRAWSDLGFGIFPLLAKKTACFWLSTDQLFDTNSFSISRRAVRAAGVLVYWSILVAAILGWLRIRKTTSRVALLLLLYCLLATMLHLPFTMNTRLRVPLIDPILCVLAGVALAPGSSQERSPSSTRKRLPSVA